MWCKNIIGTAEIAGDEVRQGRTAIVSTQCTGGIIDANAINRDRQLPIKITKGPGGVLSFRAAEPPEEISATGDGTAKRPSRRIRMSRKAVSRWSEQNRNYYPLK